MLLPTATRAIPLSGSTCELSMKFSTRTTYGLRAMIRLAQNFGEENLSLPNISRRERISLGYLERLFASLKKAKLVKAVRGASGGYKLTRSPSRITVYDIIKALEGRLSPFHCLSEDGTVYCDVGCKCGASIVLVRVQKAVTKTLKGIKLSNLI